MSDIVFPPRSPSAVHPWQEPEPKKRAAVEEAVRQCGSRNAAIRMIRAETAWTYEEIGFYFGITRSRAQQIVARDAFRRRRLTECTRSVLECCR